MRVPGVWSGPPRSGTRQARRGCGPRILALLPGPHGVTVSPEIYHAILALEYRYARLLDDDRLEEWPELFVERGVYKVIPRENWHREPKLAILFCDSRAMMLDRVRSLRTANIYNIHYPRHVVSNVEVIAARGDEFDVAAAFTVYQTDLEGQTKLFSVG